MKLTVINERIVLNTETSEEKKIVKKLYDLGFAKEVEKCMKTGYQYEDVKFVFDTVSTGLKYGYRERSKCLKPLFSEISKIFVEANTEYLAEIIFNHFKDYSPETIVDYIDAVFKVEFSKVLHELTDNHI